MMDLRRKLSAEITFSLLILILSIELSIFGGQYVLPGLATLVTISVTFFLLRPYLHIDTTIANIFVVFLPFSFFFVTGIPKIGFLPLSPLYIFILLIFCYSAFNARRLSFNQEGSRLLLLLSLSWLYHAFIFGIFSSQKFLNLQLVEATAAYLACYALLRPDVASAVMATRAVAAALVISMVWFLGEYFYPPLTLARVFIFQASLDRMDLAEAVVDPKPAGLASLPFLFGYQVAAAVALVPTLFFCEKKPFWRLVWGAGAVVTLISMVLAGERSVLLCAAMTIIYYAMKKKRLVQTVAASMVVGAILLIGSAAFEDNVFTRLTGAEGKSEAVGRLSLQVVAAGISLQNPMGLMAAGKTWEDEAFAFGADFSSWYGREIAVHNAYLGKILLLGWPFGILIGYSLLRIWKQARPVLRRPMAGDDAIAQAAVLSFLSLVIYALFHNSSLFSFHSLSVMMAFLFCRWVDATAPASEPSMGRR